MGLLLVAIQTWYFLPGFRLSGDDALFFLAAMEGWDGIWEFSKRVAFDVGRIGGFLLVPINAFAAYISEHLAFRVGLILFDFLTLAVFAWWLQRVLAFRASIFFVFLVAFHALDFMHLSPSAFPLQNTLPYSIILTARLVINGDGAKPWRWVAYLAMGLAMLTSEYAILLAAALGLVEWTRAGLFGKNLRFMLANRRLWADVGVGCAVLGIYLGWRITHPSSYDGNQVGMLSLGLFLQTWFLHSFGLFALPIYQPRLTSIFDVLAVCIAALAVGFGFVHLRRSTFSDLQWTWPAWGLGLALFVALPASATIHKQTFCADTVTGCIFLDSRAAYLFAMLAVVGGLSILARTASLKTVRIIAVITAIYAGGMMLHNVGASARMQPIASAWYRAAEVACGPEVNGTLLASTIDPESVVPLHAAGVDRRFYPSREEFWGRYVDWKRAQGCGI